MKSWFDGKLVDRDEAKVSIFDHGVLYGDGCFEGIRFYSGKVCASHNAAMLISVFNREILLTLNWRV